MGTKIRWASVVLLAAVTVVSALTIASMAKEKKAPPPPAERLYTSCNIWYEDPGRVYSTLYEKGAKIPAGTEVADVEVSGGGIRFTEVASGTKFRFQWIGKHRPGVGIEEFSKKIFTPKDFAALTAGFSSEEIEAIKAGEIRQGMSKEAVLVCAGPPPEIRTPSTSADTWFYWRDRFRNYTVEFVDGKVSRVGQ